MRTLYVEGVAIYGGPQVHALVSREGAAKR